MKQDQTNRIPSLDGLRAISISLVIFGHLCGTQGFFTTGKSIGFLSLGEFGVRFFFVISGLLITGLLLHELEATGRIHLLKFYFRRTFRIFPPYYALLLALFLLQPLGWFVLHAGDMLHGLTYTSNYHYERSWNIGHTWSLSVEEQFYLLWPATLLLLGKRRGLLAACALILLCPLIRIGIFKLLPQFSEGIGHQFETVADALATGCVLACKGEWPVALHRRYQQLLASRWIWLMPVAALVGSSMGDHPLASFLLGYTLANLSIGVCIDWCIQNHQSLLGRVLNSRPLVFVGALSYSLYLWQQIFLNPHVARPFTSFPLNLALACGAAWLSYYLIERPSLNLRQMLERKLFPKRAQQERAVVLPFDSGTPSHRAERVLRLNALFVNEERDERPTSSFLPALERLETSERRGTISDALSRLGITIKPKK